jgi:hypothetical protein
VDQHKEQQGFVTFAINTPEVDYLELAYLQCLNIKATQKENRYAVIVDTATKKLLTERHKKTFDYVIETSRTVDNPFELEPDVWFLTPFKETIKLESDLLFTRSIDHWWTAFRLKNVCLSTHAKDAQGKVNVLGKYRDIFKINNLPDVYNGLMYFRYSQEAHDFFVTAKNVFSNWEYISTELVKCEAEPSTDLVYAITSLLSDPDVVTMPSMDFLNFVHMKSGFNGWADVHSWLETVVAEQDGDIIRINNLNQYYPVHYYDKTYCTKELIKYYESRRT